MIPDPALVVVDMQKDFCRPGRAFDTGEQDFDHIAAAVDRTAALLDRYRAAGNTPILVRTVHGDDVDSPVWQETYADAPHDRPCLRGSEGAEFCDPLDVSADDVVATKHRYDAFHGTDLAEILERHDVSRVALAGVLTDVCVEYTAQSAYNHDFRVTVLEGCTAAMTPDRHAAALEKMEDIGIDVRDASAVNL